MKKHNSTNRTALKSSCKISLSWSEIDTRHWFRGTQSKTSNLSRERQRCTEVGSRPRGHECFQTVTSGQDKSAASDPLADPTSRAERARRSGFYGWRSERESHRLFFLTEADVRNHDDLKTQRVKENKTSRSDGWPGHRQKDVNRFAHLMRNLWDLCHFIVSVFGYILSDRNTDREIETCWFRNKHFLIVDSVHSGLINLFLNGCLSFCTLIFLPRQIYLYCTFQIGEMDFYSKFFFKLKIIQIKYSDCLKNH